MNENTENKSRLVDLASIIRSKNAGPFTTTIDIFFEDKANYLRVKNSALLNKALITGLYHISEQDIEGIFFVDSVCGIKISIGKQANMASGEPRCRDLFGAQQHTLLMEIEIP
jgi:hypothetical protein